MAIIVILLDLFLAIYVTSHGFSPTTNGIMVGENSFQIQWLPVLGVLVLSLAALYDAFTRVFPRWLGPEADPISRLRFMRVVTLSLAAFVCFLYIPYLLGSNWFWLHLSHASHYIGQLQGFGTWLENIEMPILSLNPVWQYSVTQILASGALVFFTWALARPARRPRKIR
jgi:hypothetical protein